MAKRSQKIRFGPSKDRIKPDTDNVSVVESDGEPADKKKSGKGKGGNRKKGSSRSVEEDKTTGTDPADASDATDDALDDDQVDDLASGYTSEGHDQNPQTCCSSCHTVFEVSRELLESSDTRVRCGECLSIFDALSNLRESADEDESGLDQNEGTPDADESSSDQDQAAVDPVEKPVDNATADSEDADGGLNNTSVLDVTYADFALFSGDAGLNEVDYLDETREVPPFDYDDLGDEDDFDESIDETLYAEDVIEDARAAISAGATQAAPKSRTAATASAAGTEQAQTEDEPATAVVGEIDELLTSLQQPELPVLVDEEPVGAWWLRGLLFLGVLILAAGLYGYRERDTLQNNAFVRPVLKSVCTIFGCTVAERVDLSALKVTKRTVFSHPDIDNTLIINIGFVNQADFQQRYPTMQIRLTDRNGSLIVSQSFTPSDYLDNWQAGDVLDAGKSLDISLNMADPGNEAMSFELDFK